jgi:hypothetical protein
VVSLVVPTSPVQFRTRVLREPLAPGAPPFENTSPLKLHTA